MSNMVNELQRVEPHYIGHSVVIRYLDDGFIMRFPPVVIGGLALELAEMLRAACPGTDVLVAHHAYDNSQRPKADENTKRMKRRVIDARASEDPGKSFLQGLGHFLQE